MVVKSVYKLLSFIQTLSFKKFQWNELDKSRVKFKADVFNFVAGVADSEVKYVSSEVRQ